MDFRFGLIVDLMKVVILFGIIGGGQHNRSSNGSICKKRFALYQVDQMRGLFSQSIVMIKIIYRPTSVTDRLAELCVRWSRCLSVLMRRRLFMVMIHAYRESSTVSPAYTMLSYRSNGVFENFSSRVLKLNTKQFFRLSFFSRSLSVTSLTVLTAFCRLSSQGLSQWGPCLLKCGLRNNLFVVRSLSGIWCVVVIVKTFHLLFTISDYDEFLYLL